MTDLKSVVMKAMAQRNAWQPFVILAALQSVASLVSGARVEWEEGDEEWGRVIDLNGVVLALVCCRIPFGFVRSIDMDVRCLPNSLEWIFVADIEVADINVDKAFLEYVFGRALSDNLNYGLLSPHDLWWATV